MRKIYNFNNKHLTKRILHKKFLINFIVFFLILEFLLIPFSVTSLIITDNTDGDEKTTAPSLPTVDDSVTNSGGDSSVKDEAPTGSDDKSSADNTSNGSSDDSSVVNDSSTEPSDDIIVEDKISYSSDGSSIEDDISTESNLDNLIDDKYTDDKNDSLVDDNLTYAPNERNVSTDEIVSISENTLGDLLSGIEKEVNIDYFEDIDSVTLTPATDLDEVKVTIIKLKDKPEEIIDPPKKDVSVYNYLDIKLVANDTYIEEDELESLEFKFKVEKSWIYNNKIDKSTIKLIRYHDGIWQNLSTTFESENESYIYYTSQSPGFSTFAVVGSKVVEKGESYSSDNVNIPWSIIIGFILLLTIMLIFILIKARYIYLKDESK